MTDESPDTAADTPDNTAEPAEAATGSEEESPSFSAFPLFADTSVWTSPGSSDPTPDTASPTASTSGARSRGWVDPQAAIDWQLVRRLKTQAVDKLEEQLNRYRDRHGKEPSVEDRREMAKPIIAHVVAGHAEADTALGYLWTPALEDRYFKACYDSQFGFGRWQPLFEIPDAEDISITRCDVVKVVHSDGTTERLPPVADSDDELLEQVRQMGANAHPPRALDAQHLDMTLQLDSRFRLHVYSDEVGPSMRVSIRQHLYKQISLGDLSDRGLMPYEVATFLDAAVRANLTIGVAGDMSAGKTTLLRGLIDSIPLTEDFATLETDLELFAHEMPGRESIAAMFARSGLGDLGPDGRRAGEVSISSLVDMALRQNLRRIIVGEVRGAEASALFQAMAVGTGTMFTVHSRNPDTVPMRLANKIAEGRVFTIEEALRQIGLMVDLIVFVKVIDNTPFGGQRYRRITQIARCSPGEFGRPTIAEIFTTDDDGNPVTFNPTPDLLAELRRYTRPELPRWNAKP